MELREMQYFLCLAEEGNVTRAARLARQAELGHYHGPRGLAAEARPRKV
jgi:hypothetical protein